MLLYVILCYSVLFCVILCYSMLFYVIRECMFILKNVHTLRSFGDKERLILTYHSYIDIKVKKSGLYKCVMMRECQSSH